MVWQTLSYLGVFIAGGFASLVAVSIFARRRLRSMMRDALRSPDGLFGSLGNELVKTKSTSGVTITPHK